MFFRVRNTIVAVLAVVVLLPGISTAEKNGTINLVSVGWTGVTIKTEIASAILQSLGYDTKHSTLSIPIVYMALSKGDADIFLGNWMPSMASICQKYFDDGSVIQYAVNMEGAKYTLAVPTYCAEAGLRHFKDIASFGDELEWKIYGIEAGNDGNLIIKNLIDTNAFGLGKFKLVASSEVAMLAEVKSRTLGKKPIVFLGWSPHSMNTRIDMTYLSGSTPETFGGNDGTATVWTNTRKGFAEDHPNVALLLRQMVFPISMMNRIMTDIHRDKALKPGMAGLKWLKENPRSYRAWLAGVTTRDGKPGAVAFEKALDTLVN